MCIFRPPDSIDELDEYYKFRWEMLRKPLNLPFGSEKDEIEGSAVHIAAFKHNKIIAAGRLQLEENLSARIRYMAVDKLFRNQGVGSKLLAELEAIAKTENVKMCWLLARETATEFYLKNNYQIKGEANSNLAIKHHRMEKYL